MNERHRIITIAGIVLLIMSMLAQFAWSIDPRPDHQTLIFPSLVPKSGNPNSPPDGMESGSIRIAYDTTFEKYWKETSYFDYNRTTGLKNQGFYVDSKTYGYTYLPWPIESRHDRPVPFQQASDVSLFFVSPIYPEATAGPFDEFADLLYGGNNPVIDGYWTPGEAFNDVNNNGARDDEIPPEDYWYADNYDPYRPPLLYAPPQQEGDWNDRRGEFYADYDGETVVDEDDDDRRVFKVAYNPAAVIYVADLDAGVNQRIEINELNTTPGRNTNLEGDFPHTYVDNGQPGGQADIPENQIFDYAEGQDFRPLVWHARDAQSGELLYATYKRYDIGTGEDARPYTGTTPVDDLELVDETVALVDVEVPIYQSAMLFHERLFEGGDYNVYGDPFDPDTSDGTWTLGTPAEPFEDFISWWDPNGGPNGNGAWTRLVDPALDPDWVHPVRGQDIGITEYEDYIRWNYPGDADALIANALNGEYDGPEQFGDVGTAQLRQQGFVSPLLTPPPDFPDGGGNTRWDGRWYSHWTDWWEALFGSPPPDWFWGIPNMTVYSAERGGGGWIPASGSWGYNSAREFCDLPSSIYYLGGDPYNAVQFNPLNINLGLHGGDGAIGEATSPFSDSFYGFDGSDDSPGGNEGPDDIIPSAGPFSYNVHGLSGYDAGNLLNLELLTRRYSPPTDVAGMTRAQMDAAVPHPAEFRDVNLDGLVDHGAVLNHEPNYASGRPGTESDGSVHTAEYPYNNARYVEAMVAAWDQSEDFDGSFRWPDSSGTSTPLYFYPIYPPSTNLTTNLGGPAGQTASVLTRDSVFPINGFLQVRPFSGGTIGGSEGGEVSGAGFGMGLLLHEQGHDLLGWPDLYDYDVWTETSEHLNSPIAGYDLMSGAMVHGIPDMKASAGWIDTQNLQSVLTRGGGPQTVEMYPITRDNDQYYVFRNTQAGRELEYFYFWYADNNTQFGVPGGPGIYVSHSDLDSHSDALPNQQRQNNHFLYEIVQADGLNQLQDGVNRGDTGDPFPGSTDKRIFTADTIPSARWWDQTDSGVRILDIELPSTQQAPALVTFEWYDPLNPWPTVSDGSDSDGDGIPDAWEMHYFGDLSTANASSDFTNDGILDIWAYELNLDPTKSTIGYDMMVPGTDITYGELLDDGDGMPYGWEIQFTGYTDPHRFDAFDDPDIDGWDNLSEYLAGTDPGDPGSLPSPTINVKIDWDGPTPVSVRWIAWDDPRMDGNPTAAGSVQPAVGNGVLNVEDGALTQGDNYIFFFADSDDSGVWSEGEPAGFPDTMPVNIGWDSAHDIRVGLSVQPVGYRRLFWDDDGSGSQNITVTRTSTSGDPEVFRREIVGRNYLHEYDFKDLGGYNKYEARPYELDNGASGFVGYSYFVDASTLPVGTFTLDWRDALGAPNAKQPSGVISKSITPFVWSHDVGKASRFKIQIREGTSLGALVYERTIAAPVPNNSGDYVFTLEDLFMGSGALQVGDFVWSVTAVNPWQPEVASGWRSFSVDTTPDTGGPFDIRGDLWYMGRADVNAADFIVQAFKSPDMSGFPVQQMVMPVVGGWNLSGLMSGTYYVRAFMDIDGDGVYSNWEPYAFLKDPGPYAAEYAVKAISVGSSSTGHLIIVRDVDTDNDHFSDAWEWQVNGNLDTVNAGYDGAYALHSTENLTAIANMLPYDLTLDSNGDGISDVMNLVLGYDVSDTPPNDKLLVIKNINLANERITFDLAAGLPDLVRAVRVWAQYSQDLINWADLPVSEDVGPGRGEWYIEPVKAYLFPAYYRLRWEPVRW